MGVDEGDDQGRSGLTPTVEITYQKIHCLVGNELSETGPEGDPFTALGWSVDSQDVEGFRLIRGLDGGEDGTLFKEHLACGDAVAVVEAKDDQSMVRAGKLCTGLIPRRE